MKIGFLISITVSFLLFIFLSGIWIGRSLEQNALLKGSIENLRDAQKEDLRVKEQYPVGEDFTKILEGFCHDAASL